MIYCDITEHTLEKNHINVMYATNDLLRDKPSENLAEYTQEKKHTHVICVTNILIGNLY